MSDTNEDLPELEDGEVEELEEDKYFEPDTVVSPLRDIVEEEMDEGNFLGQRLDPEDDLSGTEPEYEETPNES